MIYFFLKCSVSTYTVYPLAVFTLLNKNPWSSISTSSPSIKGINSPLKSISSMPDVLPLTAYLVKRFSASFEIVHPHFEVTIYTLPLVDDVVDDDSKLYFDSSIFISFGASAGIELLACELS